MADKQENVHAGHRQRMRKRFIDNGFQGMEQHEILEMLLYYAIPRKDTNALAHRLLNRYGSFAKVCDAPVDVLQKDFGLTESAAVLLRMIPELARAYTDSRSNLEYIDKRVAPDILLPKFIGATVEKVALALSDANNKLVFCDIIAVGSITSSETPVRKIVDLALRHNARYAYLAHNHPSELCAPSSDDLEITKTVSDTLQKLGVKLIDHIIFTSTDYYSIRSYKHNLKYFSDNNWYEV